ncbi:MAG: hypothetical protein IKR91_04280, partial [Alloprevotella sp.]|nr:hypothetical protein [Alloprevotella sp.]
FLKSALYFAENRVSKLFTFSSRFFTSSWKLLLAPLSFGSSVVLRGARQRLHGQAPEAGLSQPSRFSADSGHGWV